MESKIETKKQRDTEMYFKPNFKTEIVSFHRPDGQEVWLSYGRRSSEISKLFACLFESSIPLGEAKTKNEVSFPVVQKFVSTRLKVLEDKLQSLKDVLPIYQLEEIARENAENVEKDIIRLTVKRDAFDSAFSSLKEFFGSEETPDYRRAFMRLIFDALGFALDRRCQRAQEDDPQRYNTEALLKVYQNKYIARIIATQCFKRTVEIWLLEEKEADREKVEKFFEYPKIKSFR